MSCGLQITGWPAHDSAISSILFGPDETSIFSLGLDGKASITNCCHEIQILSFYHKFMLMRNVYVMPDF